MNAATSSNAPKPSASSQTLSKSLIIIALLIGLLGIGWLLIDRATCGQPFNAKAPIRILFIGNSYTFTNDLPGMFARLACAGGHRVEIDVAAEGGWTLATHAASPETLDKLKQSKWDFAILQEQSEIPASESARQQSMYPAVRELVRQIKSLNAAPILFLTWGHRSGWPEGGYQTFEAMQAQLTVGYMEIANELQIPVAPIGEVWRRSRSQSPSLDLWQDDGSHPKTQGTYLAACVFYATVFRQSPVGLNDNEGLNSENARTLQVLAADTVLLKPERWNLH